MFPVVTVESEEFQFFEQLGTKGKFWFDNSKYLFKAGRQGTGENWAEAVAAKLAAALGLPHATYELAETSIALAGWDPSPDGLTRGVVTPNFTPEGGRLILGNELIVSVSTSATSRAQHRRAQHTVQRLAALLDSAPVSVPADWEQPAQIETAGGVMAGYLLLDVLIGNQDRHEENWGFLVRPRPESILLELAPTFDHASSLGRNETDERRAEKLRHNEPAHGMQGYAARALSQFYDRNVRRVSTLDAFRELAAHWPAEAKFWIAQLSRINELSFRLLMNEVPPDWISDVARDFATELLLENRRRLLQLDL